MQQSNHLGMVSRKIMWGWARWSWAFNQFYSLETLFLILKQLQITNICLVSIGVLYLFETTQWNTYNQNHCDETKQSSIYDDLDEARTQENHKQDHDDLDHRHWQSMGSTTDIDSQAPTIWNKLRREPSFSRTDPPLCN